MSATDDEEEPPTVRRPDPEKEKDTVEVALGMTSATRMLQPTEEEPR